MINNMTLTEVLQSEFPADHNLLQRQQHVTKKLNIGDGGLRFHNGELGEGAFW